MTEKATILIPDISGYTEFLTKTALVHSSHIINELLDLRLNQRVKIEEATSWLEKITGKIEVDGLNPSWLVFAEGFRFSDFNRILRRILNFSVALIGLIQKLRERDFLRLRARTLSLKQLE